MKNKRLGIYLPFLLISVSASVTLRTLALFLDFNFDIGYFDRYTLFTVSAVIAAVSVFVMLSYLFLGAPRNPRASFATPLTYVTSGAVASVLVFVSAELFHKVFVFGSPLFENGKPTDLSVLLSLICAVLALGGVGYFFLNTYFARRKSDSRAYFSMMAVLFFALYATMLYFDTKTPINSPNKLADQAALLLVALFLLYEARISLGRERFGGYIAFGLAAAALAAYSSIPTLLVYVVRDECVSDLPTTALMLFAVFVFILARLILISRAPENEPSRAALNMEAYAETRSDAVRVGEEKYARLYETQQLSIDSLIEETAAEEEAAEQTTADAPTEQSDDTEQNTPAPEPIENADEGETTNEEDTGN